MDMSPKRKDANRQTCKACGLPDKFNFHVSDEIWARVVPPHLHKLVVCLPCFDDFARERAVDYSQSIDSLYFAGDQAFFEFTLKWGLPS
jgi:hypothetical protein